MPEQHGVGRAVDVNRVRLERGAGAAHGKLSTSSMRTTVSGRRAAISGTSVEEAGTLRWLSPSMSLGKACGLISRSVTRPREGARRPGRAGRGPASSCPCPAGPASTIRPWRQARRGRVRPCWSRAKQCLLSSRSFTSRGTMMGSQVARRGGSSRGADVPRRPAGRRLSPVRPPAGRRSSGPDDAGQVRRDQRRRLLEEHHRIHQDPHRVEEGVEHVDADQPAVRSGSSLKCWCHRKWSTTIRSPFFHSWRTLVERAVAVALDDVEPGLAPWRWSDWCGPARTRSSPRQPGAW